ncbi:hypothetical protein ERJ75_000911300 [Trypanosoma vivax]|nr:hypothetical protein ERJ75_000911300 [Trypanosoma vivax]
MRLCCSWPCVSTSRHHAGRPQGRRADKDKKVHTIGRVRRFRDFDYQVWTDVSVVLDVSSGAGALVHSKEGRGEKVVL